MYDTGGGGDGGLQYRLRIGGFDKRKVMFKGWVEVEPFEYRGSDGSFCVMQRDEVRVMQLFFFCDADA